MDLPNVNVKTHVILVEGRCIMIESDAGDAHGAAGSLLDVVIIVAVASLRLIDRTVLRGDGRVKNAQLNFALLGQDGRPA